MDTATLVKVLESVCDKAEIMFAAAKEGSRAETLAHGLVTVAGTLIELLQSMPAPEPTPDLAAELARVTAERDKIKESLHTIVTSSIRANVGGTRFSVYVPGFWSPDFDSPEKAVAEFLKAAGVED